ncbi:MAG TPA: hypothetical protein VMV60_11555 [Thermoanaerobaculia bacterium]|nr:hypothetical protein [Thermoanaerobaculia bacterium]
MRNAAVLLSCALLGAGAAFAQQQAPTPIPQNVVVPSLPDQPNKAGVVNPSGAMKTDEAGYVKNGGKTVDPAAPAQTSAPGVAPGPGIVPPASPAPAPGPHGPAVVEAAHLTLRGVVKSYEKGVSITIVEAKGTTRTVPLAAKAAVYEGLVAGDKVVLNVPLEKPGDGKHADRIEKQKPAKAPPASKFSQAQSPG